MDKTRWEMAWNSQGWPGERYGGHREPKAQLPQSEGRLGRSPPWRASSQHCLGLNPLSSLGFDPLRAPMSFSQPPIPPAQVSCLGNSGGTVWNHMWVPTPSLSSLRPVSALHWEMTTPCTCCSLFPPHRHSYPITCSLQDTLGRAGEELLIGKYYCLQLNIHPRPVASGRGGSC